MRTLMSNLDETEIFADFPTPILTLCIELGGMGCLSLHQHPTFAKAAESQNFVTGS